MYLVNSSTINQIHNTMNTRTLGKPNIYAVLNQILPTFKSQFDVQKYNKLKAIDKDIAKEYAAKFPKGVSAKEIQEKMKKAGLSYSFHTIKNALYRTAYNSTTKTAGRGRPHNTYYQLESYEFVNL